MGVACEASIHSELTVKYRPRSREIPPGKSSRNYTRRAPAAFTLASRVAPSLFDIHSEVAPHRPSVMHKTLLLAFLGMWTTSVRAHGGTRCTLRACTCIAATCLGHPPLIFGCPSQSCRRPTHVDVRPRATKPTGRRTARRCESRHAYAYVCSRPSYHRTLPTYFTVWWVRPKRHHRRARRQRQRPVQRHRLQRTQPGRCGRADRDRRPNLRCAAPVRPAPASASQAPPTSRKIWAQAPHTHPKQTPRSTSPQLSATMPRRAPGHHGGAAPGRLWTLHFVRWRRRHRREQAVSRVRG